MIDFVRRLTTWRPYPTTLQGLIGLVLLVVPLSPGTSDPYRVAGLAALMLSFLALTLLVPVRRLPVWLQVIYLVGQCGLATIAQAIAPAPLIDYVYLTIVLQAIFLFRAWLWIPFAVGVWLAWNGTILLFSRNLLDWAQSNLALAFPATCALIATILYARQQRRQEQFEQVMQQVRRRYDTLRMSLNEMPTRAVLEERQRLAHTVADDIFIALARTEQSIAVATSQAQSNLVRLSAGVAQTRLAAGAAVERLRNAVSTLRHEPAPVATAPQLAAPNPALTVDDTLISAIAVKVLNWVLPLVFVALALPLMILQQRPTPATLGQFALFCSVLLLIYGLTQRMRHPFWLQAGLAGQALAVLSLVLLTQTLPLLLGMLLVAWQIALRLSAVQIVTFLAGVQAPLSLLLLRLGPPLNEQRTYWLAAFIAVTVVAAPLVFARRQLARRRRAAASLADLVELTRELEAKAAHVRAMAVAAERTRLAREFHDDLGSKLMLINVQLQLVEELLSEDPDVAQEQLLTIRDQIRAAWRSVFRAADALATVDGATLGPALDDLVQQCRQGMQARVSLRVVGDLTALPTSIACTVYRAVQEGLTNAWKYAVARSIEVDIRNDGRQVVISVYNDRDPLADEQPLAVPTPRVAGVQGNFGLVGLRERAALTGGQVTAGTAACGGFALEVTLPINEDGTNDQP